MRSLASSASALLGVPSSTLRSLLPPATKRKEIDPAPPLARTRNRCEPLLQDRKGCLDASQDRGGEIAVRSSTGSILQADRVLPGGDELGELVKQVLIEPSNPGSLSEFDELVVREPVLNPPVGSDGILAVGDDDPLQHVLDREGIK